MASLKIIVHFPTCMCMCVYSGREGHSFNDPACSFEEICSGISSSPQIGAIGNVSVLVANRTVMCRLKQPGCSVEPQVEMMLSL